jgi:hypothetical protein
VCSLVTPLTIRGTAVTISPLAGFLSPDMLCLTSRTSPSPPPHPLRMLTLSPCFLTQWCSRLFMFFLFQQVLLVHHRLWLLRRRLSLLLHHSWFQCHSSHLMWACCLRSRHAWPLRTRHPSSRHMRPRRPSPRHTRLRRLFPCHARPRHHLDATPSPCRCTSDVRCLHRRYLLRVLQQRCL